MCILYILLYNSLCSVHVRSRPRLQVVWQALMRFLSGFHCNDDAHNMCVKKVHNYDTGVMSGNVWVVKERQVIFWIKHIWIERMVHLLMIANFII